MINKTNIIILRYLISILIFLTAWIILDFSFEHLGNSYKAMISGGIMVVLSPRIKVFENQSGKQMQVNWIFLRKTISI
jgi:hypothetical protein